ncbi:MAG: family phosphatase [Klenkia sp.]|nr:family phosphatase [Klenkia sp.]
MPEPTAETAFLWDMDGTLVDTEPFWAAAEQQLAREHGVAWGPAECAATVGQSPARTAAALTAAGVALDPREALAVLVEAVADRVSLGVPWMPGALELLQECHVAGHRLALVTSSPAVIAVAVAAAADRATGLDLFDAVVTGDDVGRPKPHPEPYLRAAGLVDREPRQCVAVEDSAPGVESAVAAGCRVIRVGRHAVAGRDAVRTWVSLAGRGLADLVREGAPAPGEERGEPAR